MATFDQLQRTVTLMAAGLIAVAFAAAWAMSPSKPPIDTRPVVVQVITYHQADRFEQRWQDLLRQLLPAASPPAPPIQLALADTPPRAEPVPSEQLSLIREAMRAPPPAIAKRAARDPVCGAKGRHYYKKNGRPSWRCIR